MPNPDAIHPAHDAVAARFNLAAAGYGSPALRFFAFAADRPGYHLRTVEDWREILWNSGFRGLLEKLPAAEREAARVAHLAELAPWMTDKGLGSTSPNISWVDAGREQRARLSRTPLGYAGRVACGME